MYTVAAVGKKKLSKHRKYDPVLNFGGCHISPIRWLELIWHERLNLRSALLCQISAWSVYRDLRGKKSPKSCKFDQIWILWLLYQLPVLHTPDRSGTNLARECRPVVYAVSWQISLWSVHRVAVDERKTRNLTIFSNSTFCVGAIWWQRDKVERGCTPTNLPVSNDIKVLTEFRRLDGDNACNSTV